MRWKVIDWLELSGQASWADYGSDIDEEVIFEAGALATFLDDRLGIGAKYGLGDSDVLRLFLRFNFGG